MPKKNSDVNPDAVVFARDVRMPEDDKDDRDSGIGVFNEKTLHRRMKDYFASFGGEKEVAIGPYTADILHENNIIEVQTGSFYPLVDKVKYYLENTDCDIMIVRPAAHIKRIINIDAQTGEIVSTRRSPRRENALGALKEIYWLREYIGNERLLFDIVLLEIDEYRVRSDKRSRRGRLMTERDRDPVRIIGSTVLCDGESYRPLLPQGLPELFCADDMRKASGIRGIALSDTIKVFLAAGVIAQSGKNRRKYVYRIVTPCDTQ